MSDTISITVDKLAQLADVAIVHGTQNSFIPIAIQWAAGAHNECLRLTEKVAQLEGDNQQLKSQRDCLAIEIEGCTKEQELWHQLHILLVPISSTPYNGLIEAAEELKAECERLRVDAARYQLLLTFDDDVALAVMPMEVYGIMTLSEWLDAQINQSNKG